MFVSKPETSLNRVSSRDDDDDVDVGGGGHGDDQCDQMLE